MEIFGMFCGCRISGEQNACLKLISVIFHADLHSAAKSVSTNRNENLPSGIMEISGFSNYRDYI
ncbi:MAG: hypothetical protein ACI4JB_09580, partial [Porcipelethomonas sp.]